MLFVPGDQPRKVDKALDEIPTDAVILDLEDAVANDVKVATRIPIAEAIGRFAAARLPSGLDDPSGPDATRNSKPAIPKQVFVRVNAVDTPWFFGDLSAVVLPGLDGIMLPKAAGPEQLYLADMYVTHLERERGLPPGGVELLPLIESAAGAANLRDICRYARRDTAHQGHVGHAPEGGVSGASGLSRLRRVGFGATDYTVDLGATWTDDESALFLVCSQMVLYSRESGLEPPIDTVYPHYKDHVGYEARCRRSRALGFGGRACIHPDQVEITNRLYQPSDEEIAWARDVIAGFEEAEAKGIAALTVRGQLVDYAFVVRARQILRRAGLGNVR
jgi:citrate lyase subunit beta / citryl-CoA lyase